MTPEQAAEQIQLFMKHVKAGAKARSDRYNLGVYGTNIVECKITQRTHWKLNGEAKNLPAIQAALLVYQSKEI